MARRLPIYKKRKNPYTNFWFFKVMYGDNHEKVMFLPPRFARIQKIEDNTDTKIKDVNGRSWPVRFSYIDGCLALQKGWPEFFKGHNLKEGHFVTFKYTKGYFCVKIFGRNAYEKRKFIDEVARQKKRARREPEPEPAQTRDVNPKPATSVSQFQNGQSQLPVANDASIKIPEPVAQDKPSLVALGSKSQNCHSPSTNLNTEDPNKFEKAVDANMFVFSDEIMDPAEVFDNALDTDMAVSDAEIMEPANEFEKVVETNGTPSHTEVTNPSGKRPIKKKQVELSKNANGRPKVSTGREPNIAGKFGQMHSPVVKTEPDLPDEVIIPKTAPFTVKVKSRSYLELPIRSVRERRERRLVYLRDPTGEIWPIHNEDIYSNKVLTTNWEQFCRKNNINPEDECKFFQVEDVTDCIYRVDVVPKLDVHAAPVEPLPTSTTRPRRLGRLPLKFRDYHTTFPVTK